MQTINKFLSSNNKERKENINRKLILMICVDNQPFIIVDDIGFLNFIKEIAPKDYKLPHRTSIPSKIANINEELVTNLYKKLEQIKNICLSSDGWSTKDRENFLSLFIHFICDDFKKNTISLELIIFQKKRLLRS